MPESPNVPAVVELIMALRVPLADPVPDGVKVMVPLVLWPAFSVSGSVIPLKTKAAPFIENCVTVRFDPPALDMEIVSALLLPTFTLPKSRLDDEN